ncbi:hypothetical protein D9758_008685 [Tetrapyrgos nigripes]|uniref:F-box domain-containing protein n=1 Tax=Tetrapyrgos nigripes TaxID=182062 RepID=A0A8H5FXT1_9AGAR|nr:hypothetical protein D9758_008685 [Tetrapyrgos nigripes]
MARGRWATLEWKDPQRLSDDVDGHELIPIPIDIYQAIFSYFQPCDDLTASECKKILSNISLSCRLLRGITIPLLFQYLNISGIGHNAFPRAGYVDFCSKVNADKPSAISLARFIRECTFRDWPSPNSGPESIRLKLYRECLNIYLPAFSRFENLQSLVFHSVMILPRILASLTKLKRLRRLSFLECHFDEVTVENIENLQIIPLTSFTLRSCSGSLTSKIHLGITTARLEEIRTDKWGVFECLIDANGELPSLKVLELDLLLDSDRSLRDVTESSFSIPALRKSLERLPALQELYLDNLKTFVMPRNVNPKPIQLPALRIVRCPFQVLALLVSEELREVTTYQAISRFPSPTNPSTRSGVQLKSITFSEVVASQLTLLEVPMPWIVGLSLEELFPTLETLALNHSGPYTVHVPPNSAITREEVLDKDIISASEAWCHLKSLHELRLRVNHAFKDEIPWHLDVQHRLITQNLITATPTLDRVSFTLHVLWRRIPYGRADEWKPIVPVCKREDVQDMLRILMERLEEYPDVFVDYDGCFASLLS